jgi:hypothetical protein
MKVSLRKLKGEMSALLVQHLGHSFILLKDFLSRQDMLF